VLKITHEFPSGVLALRKEMAHTYSVMQGDSPDLGGIENMIHRT